MFSMAADGSDIAHLSFHETHEWHPSVTNDGMLVYTRWDYVDRDTNVAHHIWTCYPDGRDPRSFHGNYPQKRENRPWMEMQIRSVPGSPLFVASTGAHHGHEFGSLVLIDPRLRDDGAMSQLVRLTPDTPFPEATRGVSIASLMRYGTPWPLSEQDFLCVYDQAAKHHAIYWIDRHGNRELIYRDDKVPCYAPIPLRPRPTPPILSEQSGRIAQGGNLADTPMANVSVVNVYDSDFDWPAGTKVHSLRIVQVLPKLTAPPNQPRVGVAQQTNARQVLGTVPVEADGSAHFQIPSGKAVYFQALDEHGLAVMSMRSAAYFQPGEKLTCQGCHERKLDTPPPAAKVPLALRRAPSTIQPEIEGSNPFSFTRLVQPALDRNCVACHKEKKAVDLSGQVGGPNGWTRSYAALAAKYGFYFDVTNGSFNGARGGSRTTAGKFGAMASPLMKYLDAKHHGVKLSAEDYRRFTLWLDLNSEFLGAYEKVAEQARGEVVQPSLQ